MSGPALEPVLALRGATLVVGGRRILDRLSLTVPQGRHTAILGANGSGKSSLIQLVSRQRYALQPADGGAAPVSVFGRERWNVFELRALLGIVSSELHGQLTATGSDAVTGLDAAVSGFFASRGLAPHHAARITPEMIENARAALALAGAAHLEAALLAEVSTGEARRVLIARALAPRPRALLLDEPTAGLDLVARRRFLETLRGIARQGTTILLVTHHVEEIVPEIEQVVLLREGRIALDAPKAEALTSAALSAAFGAPVRVREASGGYYSASAE